MKKNQLFLFLIPLLSSLLFFCSPVQADLSLTIAHINDSHGHLDSTEQTFTINKQKIKLPVGGAPRLIAEIKKLRTENTNVLFLNAGDVFSGTLYTLLYQGMADLWFLNAMEIDAMVVGNHDFDKGTNALARFIASAQFSVLGANVDTTKESTLIGKIKPYIIREYDGTKVAIIGSTGADTAGMSGGTGRIKFLDEVATVRSTVDALTKQGVSAIIVLSHTGIEDDVRMAKSIPQIDVIVGGHSHTVMGDLKELGLKNRSTRYPRVVKHSGDTKTLIVQAGDNLEMLGVLSVTFDDNGSIKDFEGNPLLLVGHTQEIDKVTDLKNVARVDEDAATKQKLTEFAQPIKKLKETIIATATEDLKRHGTGGPGPIVAESMLAKTRPLGALLALINTTGARCDIPKGPITIAKAYELLPFENKLVIVKMKGRDLRTTLEEIINRNISKKRSPPYFYSAGIQLAIDPAKSKGERITSFKILTERNEWTDVNDDTLYTLSTIDFLANGSSGYERLAKTATNRVDTGLIDADVFIDYLKQKKIISNVAN